MLNPALPVNINNLLRQRTIEGERVEYKAGWNPKAVLHTIWAFANDLHNLGGGYIVIGVEEDLSGTTGTHHPRRHRLHRAPLPQGNRHQAR